MKQVFRYDSSGFYKGPVDLEENETIPLDCTEVNPPNGLFRAKFLDGFWVEDMPQAEIDAIKNAPQPKTEIELLKEQQQLMQTAIDDLILGGML